MVLRSLNVWPDSDDVKRHVLMMAVIVNVFVMGVAHLAYVLINLAEITKMTIASTTVLVSFECIAKLLTMIHYREQLNQILTAIWLDFWPAAMAPHQLRAAIAFRSNYVTAVGVSFLCMAFFSNAQFMMYPLVNNLDELPLASWYPFNFHASPLYEMMYLWQWFLNQVIITTLSGFDAFFYAIVMICATQFQILQMVLSSIGTPNGKVYWRIINKFSSKKTQHKYKSFEMQMLVKCIQHHQHLIEICDMLEHIFSHIVLLQFVVSASAMCVSCVGLQADPDVWQHMLSYLIAHVFQFFIYCSVGSELTYQSGQIAEHAYDCSWQNSVDYDFRRALIMILLRAQKPTELTVAGLMQLSYANFIATVQLSFSFYVLLDSFV